MENQVTYDLNKVYVYTPGETLNWRLVEGVKMPTKALEEWNRKIVSFIHEHKSENFLDPMYIKVGPKNDRLKVILFGFSSARLGRVYHCLQYSKNTDKCRLISYGINFVFHSGQCFGTNPLYLNKEEIKNWAEKSLLNYSTHMKAENIKLKHSIKHGINIKDYVLQSNSEPFHQIIFFGGNYILGV